MYANGLGVDQGIAKAHMWLDIAITEWPNKQYRKDVIKRRDDLAARMTFAQITEAKKLTSEWLATHRKSK